MRIFPHRVGLCCSLVSNGMSSKHIFGAFIIAVALFFAWPTVIGTWQEVGALREARDARKALLTQRTEIIETAQTTYAEYQEKVSGLDGQKFAALVPVKKDTAELLTAIQDIASTTGVTVGEVRMSETKSKAVEQFKTLNFTLNLSGAYPSLRQFLACLEQYVRLLQVNTIEANADTRQAGLLRFVVQGDAYFLK